MKRSGNMLLWVSAVLLVAFPRTGSAKKKSLSHEEHRARRESIDHTAILPFGKCTLTWIPIYNHINSVFCPTNILFLSFLFLTEIRNESQRKSADTRSKEELRIKGPGGWHSSAVEQCEIGCCNQELHCGCLVVHNASGKYGGKKKRKQLQRHLYISPAAKGRMKRAFVQWRQRCCKH